MISWLATKGAKLFSARLHVPCVIDRPRQRGSAGVVCALDRDTAMTNDRTENLPPLAPEELAKAIPHPADRILGVRVLRWVKQINENGPSGG